MLLFIAVRQIQCLAVFYFNTSHVTVYRNHIWADQPRKWFQYISCYCLSRSMAVPSPITRISIHLMLLFIIQGLIDLVILMHFNTSHVTVYRLHRVSLYNIEQFQYISCYCLSISRCLFSHLCWISIHLMLLFINMHHKIIPLRQVFQYISCYCLSCFNFTATLVLEISIHLMLLFI